MSLSYKNTLINIEQVFAQGLASSDIRFYCERRIMGVVDAKKLSIFDPRGGKAVTSYKVAEDD
jgi:hypothetical protein